MQNRYSLWRYLLLVGLIIFAFIYAAPNLYGDDLAIQVSAKGDVKIDNAVLNQVEKILQSNNLSYLSAERQGDNLLIRFVEPDIQLRAQDILKTNLGDQYVVALNLAPRTPKWLQMLGAHPMKLGLDLRGGVHFLLAVDVNALVKARAQSDLRDFSKELRDADIRYSGVSAAPTAIMIDFRDEANMNKAADFLRQKFSEYVFSSQNHGGSFQLRAELTLAALTKIRNYAIEQNMTIITNRVNELGVSEAIVQQQGADQISVDLPGVQDTARAKGLLGKAATLRFQLVDTDHDVQSALAGNVPLGSRLYQYDGRPYLLKNEVILRGDSITYATSGIGENGRPNVTIRLGGGGEGMFHRITAENVGRPLAVIYVETRLEKRMVNGKETEVRTQDERVINIATIQSALGSPFEVTGLSSAKESQNLALLLRSGALAAPMDFIQERVVGPSLGQANIHKGVLSVEIGALLVIVFMGLYYRLFGLVADLALILNIVFIVAILSVLGATLTLPGIAGIVLTVGMAVDANVLINERIREEIRNGMSPQASIYAGYERAFITIVDANVTTLIVTIVLFALGTSTIKSFAVTLMVGLLTSMLTAIFFTRGIINLIYGGRAIKQLSIGKIRLVRQQQI